LWLALISFGGLVAPLVWILTSKLHAIPRGDALFFQYQSSLIADGAGWFISPAAFLAHQPVAQSAMHPPLWVLSLALVDFVGLTSYTSHLLFTCVLGAGAVFVTGLAGREVAGPRVGLIAAAIAAVYPNYWINDGTGLSETLVILLVAGVVLVSAKLWRRPSFPTVAILGALCALAALTRGEQLLLLFMVLIPVTLVLRDLSLRKRLTYAGVGVMTALFVMAPWVGFNMSRFSRPVVLGNDVGTTLASANCHASFYGRYLGYGSLYCLKRAYRVATNGTTSRSQDESVVDSELQHFAFRFINSHSSQLPVVLAARVGRELAFFAPNSELTFDQLLDSRPRVANTVGLFMYYGLFGGAIVGGVVLRRRGFPLAPFVGLLAEVVVSSMLAFGATRYRAPLEVGLVVLAAVAVDTAMTRRTAARRPSATV